MMRDNKTVTGVGTAFTTDLNVGDTIYATIGGARQGRKIEAITSATVLTLTSGFTAALSAGTQIEQQGLTVTGTGTTFTAQVQVGDYIVDPLRAGEAIKVMAIPTATSLKIEKPFSSDFTDVSLAKQSKRATVKLLQPIGEGLTVETALGESRPETHFSLRVFFNNSQVLHIPDASLDPNDPLFVDTVVSDTVGNVAYRSSGENILAWIRARSLWTSTYTTAEDSDVRPIAGSKILALTQTRLYTVIDLDYTKTIGSSLYISPYDQYRNLIRIKEAYAPVDLEGSFRQPEQPLTARVRHFDFAGDWRLYL
jgi:hypothetical protein